MNIFHYHPDTGIYLGQGKADESPLEPGVWLIPAHATEQEPPQPGEGEHAIWTDEGWDVQPIPVTEPEPEPLPIAEPIPELTAAEKLAAAGLTVEDLKALLAGK
jgi:hypothetical protein